MRELPILAERIGPDLPDEIVAIAGVPYGWRTRATLPGVFRIGDQGAVIASLAGDGIAMALTSGISAAEALLARGPDAAETWQAAFAHRSSRPLAVAELLRRSAERPLPRSTLMALLRLAPGLTAPAALLTRIA
jgi:flavin-dependent dehydrogenase